MPYNTLQEADAYFATRLFSQVWSAANNTDKNNALLAACGHIDRLNFAGMKNAAYETALTTCDQDVIMAASATQALQFPRGTDTEIPSDIKRAECEIAINLLDGKDPEQEFEALATVSEGYSSVRRTYNRSYAQEHILAGIVSPLAWRYLKPYLRDDQCIKLCRV